MPNSKTTVVTSLWHIRFLKTAIVYNAVVMLVFYAVYALIDFNRHFRSRTPVSHTGRLYFMLMTHTASGSSDIEPATDFARSIMGLHVLAAWMQVFLVFLAD